MSELEYMDLAFEEILWAINKNKSIIRSQERFIDEFCSIILSASNSRISKYEHSKIYIAGHGVSAKSFANGLLHLGFNVFVFGESNVPPVSDEDIIIIISKSGRANSITQVIEDSKIDDVSFLVVCDNENSYLARKSDAKIVFNPVPQRLVYLNSHDVEEFIDALPGSLINFETDDELRDKLRYLPKKSVGLSDEDLRNAFSDLPREISGISNIYRPLELMLAGMGFELSSVALLDSIIIRLMYQLNLREDDLLDYYDMFRNISYSPSPAQSTEVQNTTVKSHLVPGVGRIPFPAYSGSDPFIFVSYAHADSNRVYPEIKRLHDQGYNIWYDEGIAPGNEWLSDILEHLKACSLYIIFVTENSINSINVKKEFKYAINKKKKILPIYLEDFDEIKMDDEWEYELHNIQGILKTTLDEEEYVYKYTSALNQFGFKVIGDVGGESVPVMIHDKTYREYDKRDFVDIDLSEYEEKSVNKINILALNEILKNLENASSVIRTQSDAICKFRDTLLKAKTHRVAQTYKLRKIFVLSDDESIISAQNFALRLTHFGFDVYLNGESNVPPVSHRDVAIVISQSGQLNSWSEIIKEFRLMKVKILSVCGSEKSELANMSDVCIVLDCLPQRYYNLKFDEDFDDVVFSLHPELSELHGNDVPLEVILNDTPFKISSIAFLNALVIELMYSLNLRQKDLIKYHDVLSSYF